MQHAILRWQEFLCSAWQQVFVEYVMLREVNDGPQQAHELGALLQGRDMVLNLIPWNPVGFLSPSLCILYDVLDM